MRAKFGAFRESRLCPAPRLPSGLQVRAKQCRPAFARPSPSAAEKPTVSRFAMYCWTNMYLSASEYPGRFLLATSDELPGFFGRSRQLSKPCRPFVQTVTRTTDREGKAAPSPGTPPNRRSPMVAATYPGTDKPIHASHDATDCALHRGNAGSLGWPRRGWHLRSAVAPATRPDICLPAMRGWHRLARTETTHPK